MKKRTLIAVLMALILCGSMLAGCGGPSDSVEESDTIKVGFIGPLTGDVAQYGTGVRNGVKIYIDELNAAGGVLGKQVELVEYDDKGNADDAITGFNRLVEQDKVVAIFGSVTSGPTFSVAQESAAMADPIPVITASATAEEITSFGDNMFRTCFIDPFQGETLAGYAVDVLGAKTAAIIYNNSTDYSAGLKEAFEAKCKEIGLEIVATESYGENTVDFKAQLTNIAATNPDVLFVPDYYSEAALIAQQSRDLGMTAPMLGADGWDGILNTVTDASVLEGSFFSNHASNEDPDLAAFVAKYNELYGEDPISFACTAYDAAVVMFEAIKSANTTDSAAVIEAIKASDVKGITGQITFDENNNPIKDAAMIGFAQDDEGNYQYKFDQKYSL